MDVHGWAGSIIDGCWMVFIAVWIIAAFSTKKAAYKQSIDQRAIWTAVIMTGAILLVEASRAPSPLDVRFVPKNSTIAALSAFLCICGLAFTLWARATIGRNWSGRVTLKENHELIERGPYRLVRHPIYSGLTLMIFATALFIARIGALAGWLLIVAGFWIKLSQEERLMLGQFPDQYAAYRKRVKRIIPFVLMS